MNKIARTVAKRYLDRHAPRDHRSRSAFVVGKNGYPWPSDTTILDGFTFPFEDGSEGALEDFESREMWTRGKGVWQCTTAPTETAEELKARLAMHGSISGEMHGREWRAKCAITLDRPYLHVTELEIYGRQSRHPHVKTFQKPPRFDDFLKWASQHEHVQCRISHSVGRMSTSYLASNLRLMDRLALKAEALGGRFEI